MTNLNLLVSHSIREPITMDQDNFMKLLTANKQFQELDLEQQMSFVSGLLSHQEKVTDERSKVFAGEIVRVEYFERKSDKGFVLGEKARIVFLGKSEDGEEEEQSIDTDWLSCSIPDNFGATEFDFALSQNLVALAEENIGEKVGIRKVFKEADLKKGKAVRYLGNIIPNNNSKSPLDKVLGAIESQGIDLEKDDVNTIKSIVDGNDKENYISALKKLLNSNDLELADFESTSSPEVNLARAYVNSVFD